MHRSIEALRRRAHQVLEDALADADPRTRIHAAVVVLGLTPSPVASAESSVGDPSEAIAASAKSPVKSPASVAITSASSAAPAADPTAPEGSASTTAAPAAARSPAADDEDPTVDAPRPGAVDRSTEGPAPSIPRTFAGVLSDPPLDLLERQCRARTRAQILGEPPPEPPRVGHLVVRRRLGGGAMGMVYAAYDERLDREVALKLIHPELAAQTEAEVANADQQLLDEARSLARLSHPNLVPVFDVGTWEDQAYVTMELVSGPTLRSWEAEPRPWTERIARWLEVARALQAVHSAGLLHRDIKPDNVVVGDDGRSRLVDFGLATPIEGRPASCFAGTPGYMAPELWAEDATPTVAADLYSLCVALYESLCGRRPEGPVQAGQPLPLPDGVTLPPRLVQLLTRGLAARPEDRPRSADEIIEVLTAVLGEHDRAQAA